VGVVNRLVVRWSVAAIALFVAHPEETEDGFLFVPAVTARVYTYGHKLPSLPPTLNGKGRNSEDFGHFADCKKIRKIVKLEKLFLSVQVSIGHLVNMIDILCVISIMLSRYQRITN